MFGFSKKSYGGIKVIDKVWLSQQAKFKACADMLSINPSCLFIAWFEQTANDLANSPGIPAGQSNVLLVENISTPPSVNGMIVFVEHHPLASEEQKLFASLQLSEVPVLSSLDEPFFEKFGASGTVDLMRRLGMKEDEVLGHDMITKSIRNAQESLARKAKRNLKARSQREWIELNV